MLKKGPTMASQLKKRRDAMKRDANTNKSLSTTKKMNIEKRSWETELAQMIKGGNTYEEKPKLSHKNGRKGSKKKSKRSDHARDGEGESCSQKKTQGRCLKNQGGQTN